MHEHASTINNNPITRKKDEYGIETKEKRNYRAPSNLHPRREGRGFSRELGA